MARVFGSETRWPELFRGQYGAREMSRLLGGGALQYALQAEFPLVNVWANQEGALLMAQMPGVSADDLDITVHQYTVTLRGTRDDDIADDARLIRRERAHGSFSRAVALPFRIDAGRISANLDRGILRLELPRPEEDKPRHIKIAH